MDRGRAGKDGCRLLPAFWPHDRTLGGAVVALALGEDALALGKYTLAFGQDTLALLWPVRARVHGLGVVRWLHGDGGRRRGGGDGRMAGALWGDVFVKKMISPTPNGGRIFGGRVAARVVGLVFAATGCISLHVVQKAYLMRKYRQHFWRHSVVGLGREASGIACTVLRVVAV